MNLNHDKEGKFTSGPGAGAAGALKKMGSSTNADKIISKLKEHGSKVKRTRNVPVQQIYEVETKGGAMLTLEVRENTVFRMTTSAGLVRKNPTAGLIGTEVGRTETKYAKSDAIDARQRARDRKLFY